MDMQNGSAILLQQSAPILGIDIGPESCTASGHKRTSRRRASRANSSRCRSLWHLVVVGILGYLCSKLPDGMGVAVSGALLLCRRKVCARLPPLLSILFLFQLIVHVSEPVQSTTKTGVKSIAASGKKRNH
jgi:hypothetical protein